MTLGFVKTIVNKYENFVDASEWIRSFALIVLVLPKL